MNNTKAVNHTSDRSLPEVIGTALAIGWRGFVRNEFASDQNSLGGSTLQTRQTFMSKAAVNTGKENPLLPSDHP